MREYDNILSEMENYAREHRFPIIGPMVGPFLRQIAVITNAKRILELGSGFGYSALWFAGGIDDDAKIICIDGSEDNRNRALDYHKRAGVDYKVEYHVGNALEVVEQFVGPFDIIFNDIDKDGYPDAFDAAIPRLKKGGIFITDNLLWSGRIFDDSPDESTKGVIEFTRKLFESGELLPSIIPIRDGLGIGVKI